MARNRTPEDDAPRPASRSERGERGMPSNEMAEQLVLGAILMDDSLYHQASAVLDADDFSVEKHRRIYRRMGELSDQLLRIDRVTVADRLMRYGELESVGGLSYLVDLDSSPQLPNLDSYIGIVKEKARLRRVIFTAQNIQNRAFVGEDDSQEIIESASQNLLDICGGAQVEACSPADILHNYPGGPEDFLNPSRRSAGLPTGYLQFDRMTGGLRPGELFILAGRPSSGKSSLARNICQFVSLRQQKLAVIFSLEMSKESVLQAMTCAVARVDSQDYRLGELNLEERDKAKEALAQLVTSPNLLIDDTSNLTVPEMRARVRKIQKTRGPVGLVAVDYLQLMASKGKIENRTQEVSAQTRGLKISAKELGVPIMVLSQLSRAVETRKGDHRPQLSDLRESGAIEQDADLVGFVFREEMYSKDKPELRGQAELILAKQRQGPIGTVKLSWLAHYTKFENSCDDVNLYNEGQGV